MSDSRTVVLVEDHALTRAGLRAVLDGESDLRVVAEADDGPTGLAAIAAHRPSVAVIDIGLPGIDGIELVRRARIVAPSTHFAILTVNDLESEILAALGAGANSYSLKTSPPERIVAAVRAAAYGGTFLNPAIAGIVMSNLGAMPSRPIVSPLTPRETEVLRLIASGTGNVEIAKALHIGLGTVKGHIRDILEKLSAGDRTQAAVLALRRGLI